MSTTFSTAAKHRVKTRVRAETVRRTRVSGCKVVADLLGVSPAAVKAWESGRVMPSFNMARRLAPLLGLNPDTGEAVEVGS